MPEKLQYEDAQYEELWYQHMFKVNQIIGKFCRLSMLNAPFKATLVTVQSEGFWEMTRRK